MSTKKLHQPAPERFNDDIGCSTAPFSHSGPLGSLFENLAQGETPNFLQMMAALSEIAYEMTGDDGHCFDCQRG